MDITGAKAAIYLRVSTEDQHLENQRAPLVRYAEAMGYDFDIFQEKESTRKTRPVHEDLYKRLMRKEYDILLIWKFDRWARSTRELLLEVETLIEKGIAIHSHTDGIDLSSAIGKATLTIISAFAQLERDLISERTKEALKVRKENGVQLGRPRVQVTPEEARAALEVHGSQRKAAVALGISLGKVNKLVKEGMI